MQKKRLNLLFFIILLCLVIGFFVIKDKGYLNADNSSYIISNKVIKSLDNNDPDYELQVLVSRNEKKFRLKYKKSFFVNRYINLNGFEEDIKECQDQPIDLGKEIGRSLCFIGEVGAHSENIVFIRKSSNKQLETIPFLHEGKSSDNAISDLPRITRKDINNDKTVDLVIENRDYATDPLTGVVKDLYLGTKEGFVFDRSENIQYDIGI